MTDRASGPPPVELASGKHTPRLPAAGVSLASLVLASACAASPAAPPSLACAKNLEFSDNFSGKRLGDAWLPLVRTRGKAQTDELQAYAEQNVKVQGGALNLQALKGPSGAYSSGRIHSKASYRYGCFEVRAMMPAGPGLWPAIWLRTTYGQPINGEIDMMEGFGSHPGVFQSTLHRWKDEEHLSADCARVGRLVDSAFALKARDCAWRPQTLASKDFGAGFHRYGLVWTPRRVTWFLDGEEYFSVEGDLPSMPMTFVLNLSVGGVFDGPPTEATPFPSTMLVDSVRVWRLAEPRAPRRVDRSQKVERPRH